MAIDFPNSPATNDTYSYGGKTWIWNGTAWQAVIINPIQGLQGVIGLQGIKGSQGIVSSTTAPASTETLWIDTTSNTLGVPPSSLTINTSTPLSGGGDLTSNRTISLDTSADQIVISTQVFS
jgi:hypothetical protein